MRPEEPPQPWVRYQRGEGCTATWFGIYMLIVAVASVVFVAIGAIWVIVHVWQALF